MVLSLLKDREKMENQFTAVDSFPPSNNRIVDDRSGIKTKNDTVLVCHTRNEMKENLDEKREFVKMSKCGEKEGFNACKNGDIRNNNENSNLEFGKVRKRKNSVVEEQEYYDKLVDCVPTLKALERKPNRLAILNHTCDYIRALREMLTDLK